MTGVRLMSEIAPALVTEPINPGLSGYGVSAGALLRQAREAAGLHIAALAVSLKVPVKKLEALESDRLDLLPDAVFARALASSMCRALKIDAVPILERLPSNATPRLQSVEQNINMPFHAPGERVHGSVLDKLSKPVVLVVLALLVAALVMILFPSMKIEGESVVSTTEKGAAERATLPATVLAIAVPPAAHDKPPPDAAMALPQPSPNPGLPLVASAQIVLPSSAGNSTVAADIAATSVVAALPAGGVSSGLVVLKAKGTSWVEVTDGNGVIQVRKTLAAGEAVGASGVLPLSVVVGRADNTEVQVRGKDYDLSRIVKDNVARFEVK